MKRDRALVFLISFLLVTSLTSLPLKAELPSPSREPTEGTAVMGDSDIDPYSVELYKDMNYKDLLNAWKLAPGMRLLKVYPIDDMTALSGSEGTIFPQTYSGPIGSILLGSKVGVILFPDPEFTSQFKKLKSYDVPWLGTAKANKKYWLIHSKRIESSTPEINKKHFPRVGSFVIYRKDVEDVIGVLLQSGEDWAQFLSLPESPSQTDIIYKKIPAGGPFKLSLISGYKSQWIVSSSGAGGGGWQVGSHKGHPRPDDVQVFVGGSSGGTAKLIEPNSQKLDFDLGKDYISSIRIIYKGPFGASAYLPSQPTQPKTHRAPPAPPPKPPVSLAKDSGTSSGRSIYDLTRTFESGGSSSSQQGSPSGMDTTSMGTTPMGTTPMGTMPMGTTPGSTGVLPQQKSTGTTSAFGDIRKSMSMPSSRGVGSKPGYPQTGDQRLLPDDPGDRQAITAAQPSMKGSAQILPELPPPRREEVARSRDSQVQQGRVSLPESGQIPARTSPPPAGRVEKPPPVLPSGREEELIRTREMQQGKARPPERVTAGQTQAIRETPPKRREEAAAPEKPPSDRQARREPVVPVQREMAAKIAAPDIAGRWGSSIGSVYEITQRGNGFAWSVKNIREKGDGTIEGNKLSARWSGQNGSGSAEGKITEVDGSGKATRIEWSNGVIFYRGKASRTEIKKPDTKAIPIHLPSTGDSREKEPKR